MGDFSMTCSLSGLGISGGTAVRCLLLTASPYGRDDPRNTWIVRTPPLRATYDSYGSVEKIHPDDKFIADLWLRGLREDLIEKGLGDNQVHDVPTARDMSLDALLDAVRAGRVEVRQDAKHFWHRPHKHDHLGIDAAIAARAAGIPSLRNIEGVLAQDAAIVAAYPDPVSRESAEGKFVVDEPVPHLVRVRFGRYQHDKKSLAALAVARDAVARAGFVSVVAAGSGRYANEADLLVLPAPNAKDHICGPQWDMAAGQGADDKKLAVAMAMVREDVWQAIVRYPHSDTVALDCTTCGQEPWYHDKGRCCPGKSVNGKPFKKHSKDAHYAHGPVFPDGVEHIVVTRDYGETVWYDLAAFRAGARETWQEVLDHFSEEPKKLKKEDKPDAQRNALLRGIEAAQKKEAARIAKLPAEERAKLEAEQKARLEAWEAEQREKLEHPCFGDFLITDFVICGARRRTGAWLFRDSVPGVIGVSAHLSMCLADKLEVPLSVIDAIAELSAVSHVMHGVGVTWKPATSTGPQYPEWDQHLRFVRTLMKIVEGEDAEDRRHLGGDEHDEPGAYAALVEIPKSKMRSTES